MVGERGVSLPTVSARCDLLRTRSVLQVGDRHPADVAVTTVTRIRLDTPAGLVVAEVAVEDGAARSVTIENVASFASALDQRIEVAALGPIRYDHAFGGNPALVSLFGHSSGADAIAQLMLAPEAAGLFRRAMLHSAPLGLTRNRQRMLRAMRRAVGAIPPGATAAEVLAHESAVIKAARWQGLKSGMPFGPEYGAAPLPPEAAIDARWTVVAPHIDVLIGATAEDWAEGSAEAVLELPLFHPWNLCI